MPSNHIYPWKVDPPSDTTELLPPNDVYITLDRWPRLAFEEHYHDAFNWLVAVRPGTMTVRISGQKLTLNGNSWICFFPNEPHAVESVSEGMEVLSLFFSHEEMFKSFQKLGLTLHRRQRFIFGAKGSIAQGLALQWAELRFPQNDDRGILDLFRPFLCTWIWEFYRRGWSASADESIDDLLKLKLDKLGESICSRLKTLLGISPFPWNELAENLGMSQRSLQRKISEALGMSPTELLVNLRITAARELLEDPSYEIALIALKCGFSSQSHFSTVFKTQTGVSPRQFRIERTEIKL